MSAEAFWDAARTLRRDLTGEGLQPSDIDTLNALIASWKPVTVVPQAKPPSADMLTAKVALEIVCHEAIVREAYKDSVGIWTWGIGVTNASGHVVYPRYKDSPQSIERCLEVFVWLLRAKYIPDVVEAFDGFTLTEAQFAAALSFHYNTGAIKRASWVAFWKGGKLQQARDAFMEWRKPPEIISRRTAERDLFFEGTWCASGMATVYPVKKPSYSPNWGHAEKVDVRPILSELLK